MTKNELSVRELEKADIPALVNYWMESESMHLVGMGVDLRKMPAREQFEEQLFKHLNTPLQERKSFCLIWMMDGKAIGHSNTNPTLFGEEAFMHMHIWNDANRKMGLGRELAKLSIAQFFKVLHLKRLFCEPYALNEAPNKTLVKLGFRFEKEYITTPGAITFEQPVNRWVMTKETFERQFIK